MAAESSHGAGCPANRAEVAERRLVPGLVCGPYRRGRACHGTSRFVREREIPGGDAAAPLGQRTESLSADSGRCASGRRCSRRLRSEARRSLAQLSLRAETVASASTAVATARLDRVPAIRRQRRRVGTVDLDRNPRLRPVHAANQGPLDHSNVAGSFAGDHGRIRAPAIPSRLLSAASGTADGWGGRRSRSWQSRPGRVPELLRGRGTWFHGPNGAFLRPHPGRSRVRSAPVHDTNLSPSYSEGS